MRRITIISLWAIAFLVMFNEPGFASENITDTIEIDELVFTGSKQYQSAGNVTQKIDIIRSGELETAVTGNNNIAEVLQAKAGSSVSALSRNDANWGTYGGIGPKYSTYMLNGLPLDAFVDPMALDLMAVERIEIQRGPASVLYPNYLSQDFAGNQSPLAGTVNLILKENIDHHETQFLSSYGSYNTLNTQFYHQDVRNNMSYFTGLSYENSDYTDYGTDGSWLNMQKDPEYQKTKLFAGASYVYGEKKNQRLNVFVNHTLHAGDAGRIYRGYRHNYSTVNINQSSVISPSLIFNASAGLRIYDRTSQSSHFNVIDSLDANEGVYQRVLPADVHITWKQGGKHNLIAGVDYQYAQYYTYMDALLGYDTYGNKSRAFQGGFYIQEELNFGGLTARGGVRFNYLQTTIDLISGGNPGENTISYPNFLWSAGLKYRISGNISVYANAGNSFIAPGLKSMGGTISLNDQGVAGRDGQLPNPDLRPESGLGVDLGTDLNLIASLRLSARVFYMIIDDAIVDNRVSENPSQSQSINAGNTTSMGIEGELSYSWNDLISCFVNTTLMNTNIENEIDEDQDGSDVTFAPGFIANAGLNLTTPFNLRITPVINYTGTYYDSTSRSGRNEFTPGALINLFISQQVIDQDNYSMELFVRVYNMTNNKYEMPWQFKNTGTSITGGFRVSFK